MKQFIALFLLLCSLYSMAQTAEFSAEADTNRILIGDQIVLRLKLSLPENRNFQWPLWPDSTAGLELVKIEKGDTSRSDGQWQIEQRWYITSFDSGYFAIPPLVLATAGERISTQAIAIEVVFPEVEAEQDYYDIKEPLEVERNWLLIILSSLGILLFLAGIIYLIYYFRKDKVKKYEVSLPPLPPAEFALRQLSELAEKKAWETEEPKVYYSQLIDILRLYLKRRYGISTMESTADEMIEELESIEMNEEQRQQLAEMLRLSVMVKYARSKPSAQRGRASLEQIREFVEYSRPQPKKEEENDA